jgi:hypothetical protein
MKILIVPLMLSGCGGGVMESALINAGTNVASSIVIDEVKGKSDCGKVE